jgi:type IV pilus assembly protein PilM
VVLGISSQRAMVRQLEMPQMSDAELGSALRYEIGELLPIPVEQAVFDFAVLGPGKPKADGGRTTQVLVVVAQRDIVWDSINVARRAGLRVRAVDSSPLAMLRAVPSPEGQDMEAVVSIGSQLVVVAIREGATPRFIRTVAITTPPTGPTANQPARTGAGNSVGAQSAPPAAPHAAASRAVTGPKRDYIVEEVRGSLEYFLSHNQSAQLSGIWLTGGGALIPGVSERIGAAVGTSVRTATIGAAHSPEALDLSDAQERAASARWCTAVGLALWGTGGLSSPSLLPAEIKERARRQQAMVGAGAGVLALCVALGAASVTKMESISSLNNQVKADQLTTAGLEAQIAGLQSVTQIEQSIAARRDLEVKALSGDINWVGLEARVVAALPAGVHLGSINFTEGVPGTSSASTPGSVAAPSYIGQVTISAQTSGGPAAVAQFVDRVAKVDGLAGLWVSNTAESATTGGTHSSPEMTFQATAEVTPQALSNRAAQVPGAQP